MKYTTISENVLNVLGLLCMGIGISVNNLLSRHNEFVNLKVGRNFFNNLGLFNDYGRITFHTFQIFYCYVYYIKLIRTDIYTHTQLNLLLW